MDAGLLGNIISGATNLAGSFVSFGANIYAVNHQQVPEGDNVSYNIVIPEPKQDIGESIQIYALVAVVLIIVMIVGFLIYKKL